MVSRGGIVRIVSMMVEGMMGFLILIVVEIVSKVSKLREGRVCKVLE